MTKLSELQVGDRATVQIVVTGTTPGGRLVKADGWAATAGWSGDTQVYNVTKAPAFKVGDRVKVTTYNNTLFRNITKFGKIKFMDEKRAWVDWEANTAAHLAAHESLMKIDNLVKAPR